MKIIKIKKMDITIKIPFNIGDIVYFADYYGITRAKITQIFFDDSTYKDMYTGMKENKSYHYKGVPVDADGKEILTMNGEIINISNNCFSTFAELEPHINKHIPAYN